MTINLTSPPSKPQRKHSSWLAAAGLAGALVLGLPSATYAQDAAATAGQQQDTSQASARAESTSTDSTKWGYKVDRHPRTQNPPGYRGMERPAGLDSAQRKSQTHGQQAAREPDSTSATRMGQDSTGDSTRFGVNAQEQSSNTSQSSSGDSLDSRGRDSVDIVHRQRQVAPGVGHKPPPYPPDSERAWVQVRPGNDSVSLRSGDSSSTTSPSPQ